MPDPEDVLRVDGRVIRGAAGRDDHVLDAAVADRRGEGIDRAAIAGLGREQARGGRGLFEDLLADGHDGPASRRTGSRPGHAAAPVASRTANSAAASASSDARWIEYVQTAVTVAG